VADTGGRNTVVVAIAGIAATAIVGITGTAVSWFSARADRASQRVLARDDRVFNRRAAVYLDAIGLVEKQRDAFLSYSDAPYGTHIPYQEEPSKRLLERLVAFASGSALSAFNETEDLNENVLHFGVDVPGNCVWNFRDPHPKPCRVDFLMRKRGLSDAESHRAIAFSHAYVAFAVQQRRFEAIVHHDLSG